MEAAYTSLYLWKGMVEKAESFDVADVQEAADGVTFDAPEGSVTVNGDNHHVAKTALIGKIGPDGLITDPDARATVAGALATLASWGRAG